MKKEINILSYQQIHENIKIAFSFYLILKVIRKKIELYIISLVHISEPQEGQNF